MQQIKEYDVKLLRDILEYWNTLSEDTNALDCMTDHCHVEYWDGIELANRLEAIVRQGVSQPVQTAGSKPINFEFSGLTKQEKDELILGAIDNVQNPKKDVTFEQANWLRFTSYLRKKGWYIAKF